MNPNKWLRPTLAGLFLLSLCQGNAVAQATHETALKNLKFRSVGPAVMGGRIDDFAVVESDPRIIYVATAAGGILKSVNSGVTWEPIFDDQPNPSIGDLTLAPLVSARSKDTGKDEPLAWAYPYDKGRIFQTVLGHSAESIRGAGPALLIRRGCVWAAGRPQRALAAVHRRRW